MKQVSVTCLAVFMVLLGLPGVGQAQPPATVQVQGAIRGVDCQASALTLETPGGVSVYRTAASAAIMVNATGVPFCGLRQYLGASANVWLTAMGNQLVITRIDAVAQTYQPTYRPSPAAAPATPAPYGPPYSVNGAIQAFDCQTNTLVLGAQDGVHVFPMAPNAAVFINGARAAFCALRQFTGSYAVVWVGANGGGFFAGRVDVYAAAAVPPPGYYPAPYYPYYYWPPISIGIGFVFGGCCFHHHH